MFRIKTTVLSVSAFPCHQPSLFPVLVCLYWPGKGMFTDNFHFLLLSLFVFSCWFLILELVCVCAECRMDSDSQHAWAKVSVWSGCVGWSDHCGWRKQWYTVVSNPHGIQYVARVPFNPFLWMVQFNPFPERVLFNPFLWTVQFNPFPVRVLFNPFPARVQFNSFLARVLFKPFPVRFLFNPYLARVQFNPFPEKIQFNPFPAKVLFNHFPERVHFEREFDPSLAMIQFNHVIARIQFTPFSMRVQVFLLRVQFNPLSSWENCLKRFS